MKTQFSNITVRGITAALPKQSLNLLTLSEKFGEVEVKRIIASTGIHTIRQVPDGMTCSDLCAAATLHLCKSLGLNPSSIDAIVFVSQTPDFVAPATSIV